MFCGRKKTASTTKHTGFKASRESVTGSCDYEWSRIKEGIKNDEILMTIRMTRDVTEYNRC